MHVVECKCLYQMYVVQSMCGHVLVLAGGGVCTGWSLYLMYVVQCMCGHVLVLDGGGV